MFIHVKSKKSFMSMKQFKNVSLQVYRIHIAEKQ